MATTEREAGRRAVPAVTRAIGILRQLGKEDEPVGVNQIAREQGMVPSTCLHILRVLADEGLVAFDPITKKYTIDVGILAIARSAIQRNSFVNLVESRLTDLSVRFGVTGIATRLIDPEHMVVVALSQAPLAFRLQVDLGSRFPALISATGRCLAAFSDIPEDELRTRFDALKWDHPPSFAGWLQEIAETRARGYAVDRSAYISGVTVLAVPFFERDSSVRHSLVAIGITERLDEAGVDTLAAEMIRIRDEVDSLLVGSETKNIERRGGPGRRRKAS